MLVKCVRQKKWLTFAYVSLLLGRRRQLLADDKADLREFKERFLVG